MRRLLAFFVACGFAAAAFLAAPADAADRYGKQKALYHVNYPGGENSRKYKGTLRNIQNHINAVGVKNVEIKVVMHSRGLFMLRDAMKDLQLQGTIANLKRQNVSFVVCKNTLGRLKLDPEKDLFEVFPEDIVPSGVAEIAHLQSKGYAYLKP